MKDKKETGVSNQLTPAQNADTNKGVDTDKATINNTIVFSKVVRNKGSLGKSFLLDEAEQLRNETHATLEEGTIERVELPFSELPDFLPTLGNNEAITLGVPADENFTLICTEDDARCTTDGAWRSRSNKNVVWPEPVKLVLIDVDRFEGNTGANWQLSLLFSPCSRAGRGWLGSEAIAIGLHLLRRRCSERARSVRILFMYSGDVDELKRTLLARSWLAGHGLAEPDSVGKRAIKRHPFDHTVFQASRLVFEGAAALGPELSTDRLERCEAAHEGGVVHT